MAGLLICTGDFLGREMGMEREIESLKELINQRFDGVDDRLDGLTSQVKETNGRLRKAETEIAILEDRSPGRVGMIAGGAVSGLAWVVWMIFEAIRK